MSSSRGRRSVPRGATRRSGGDESNSYACSLTVTQAALAVGTSIYARTPGAAVLAFEDTGEETVLTAAGSSTEPHQIGTSLLMVP